MTDPSAAWERLILEEGVDLKPRLRTLPTGPGVAQLLDAQERSLLIGRPAGLRRWVAEQLGLGRRRRGRPATDLSGVARSVVWSATTSHFERRLRYERLMARWVAPADRRDLPPPAWLHLDAAERFPRLTPRVAPRDPAALFGPFASRDRATRARDRLHRLFPLRPCEVDFEPHPRLPLGLGCLHAQLRTCAAPCLQRVGEAEYRALAAGAAGFLAAPAARPAEAADWLPEWVGAADARAVVVEPVGEALQAWPLRAWSVLDDGQATAGEPAALLAGVSWSGEAAPLADAAWLLDWLCGKRAGVLCVAEGTADAALARRVEEALAVVRGARDNVGHDQP